MVAAQHEVQLKLLPCTDVSWTNWDLWGKVFAYHYRHLKEEVIRAY